jgi:predicted nucleic acid-binding protein
VIVVDASVIVEVIIGSAGAADRLADARLTAPAIIDAEVGNAVRRHWRHGSLSDERASIAIDALSKLEILRFEHRELLPRAWELRHDLTFTDGLYVALAEQLGIPLVTLDARIAAAPHLKADVEMLARYR